jgi:hypothetical protein
MSKATEAVTYELTLSRKDKKPVDLSAEGAVKLMRKLVEKREKQLTAESVKRARESTLKAIEYLRTERPELYMRFINKKESLDSCLEIIRGEKRLVTAVRSGRLR